MSVILEAIDGYTKSMPVRETTYGGITFGKMEFADWGEKEVVKRGKGKRKRGSREEDGPLILSGEDDRTWKGGSKTYYRMPKMGDFTVLAQIKAALFDYLALDGYFHSTFTERGFSPLSEVDLGYLQISLPREGISRHYDPSNGYRPFVNEDLSFENPITHQYYSFHSDVGGLFESGGNYIVVLTVAGSGTEIGVETYLADCQEEERNANADRAVIPFIRHFACMFPYNELPMHLYVIPGHLGHLVSGTQDRVALVFRPMVIVGEEEVESGGRGKRSSKKGSRLIEKS